MNECYCYCGTAAPTWVVAIAKKSQPSENSSRGEEKREGINIVIFVPDTAGIMPLPPLILDKFFLIAETHEIPLLLSHSSIVGPI
jgi:hypothetical protein